MSSEQNAAADFERLLLTYPALFRGLVSVMDEIATIGSIKQAAAEAQARLDKAKSELSAFEHDLATRRTQADAYVADQVQKVDDLRAQAKQQAEQTAREAADHAQTLIANARAEADRIEASQAQATQAFQDKDRQAQQNLSNVEQQIADRTAQLDALNRDIVAAEARLSEINSHIENLRAKF